MDCGSRATWTAVSVQVPRRLKTTEASCIELILDFASLRVVEARVRSDEGLMSGVFFYALNDVVVFYRLLCDHRLQKSRADGR